MSSKVTSVVPSGNNNYLTPSLTFNRPATDFILPGVVGYITNTSGVSPSTGFGAVNAQGTPNMSVAVTGPSIYYVNATPSGGTAQTFSVTQDVSENVTINNNSTGSTVYDFIYLQLSATLLNNPDSADTTVASFFTSRSTTNYATGNSNGAQANTLLLAVVTVANGASSISNSNITDARAMAGPSSNIVYPVQAATASAPPYIKGGLYYDTTLHKLRVGGASAWETVTSS
jgi:hypothetical protein